MSLSFKYRIYPTPETERKLMETMKRKRRSTTSY
ncbi:MULTISPECIES: helix-turn-helix domain-containing protein [Metallosphaera]